MRASTVCVRAGVIACFCFLTAVAAFGATPPGGYDTAGAWPLCGNYYNDSAGATATSCPSSRMGSTAHRDRTNDAFGPRLRAGDYNWHRGIDLDTDGAIGRSVFAYSCGEVVRVEGDEPNRAVVIQHFRNYDCTGTRPTTCGTDGCYFSRYKHLDDVLVSEQDPHEWVDRGAKIGTSGINCEYTGNLDGDGRLECDKPHSSTHCYCDASTGVCDSGVSGVSCFEHVHFEVRDSYGSVGSGRSQRRVVHPLAVLPYNNTAGAGDITLSFDTVVTSSPLQVTLDLSMPNTDMSNGGMSGISSTDNDLARVEIEVYENMGTWLYPVTQPNPGALYTTPEGDAYQVHPPFLDFRERSRQYNYENSPSTLPFSDFRNDGTYESPFADTTGTHYDSSFPASYDADYHLGATVASNDKRGDFNGIEVEPADYNFGDATYDLEVKFKRLTGPSDLSKLCLKAFAVDARGVSTDKVEWGDCDTTPPPPPPPAAPVWVDVQSALCYGLNDIDWPAVSGATFYEVWLSPRSSFSGSWLDAKTTMTGHFVNVSAVDRRLYVRVRACNAGGCGAFRNGDEPADYLHGCL
ncbi:MAG: M23 family metallopeptidase [Acidobacteriota bacterium]